MGIPHGYCHCGCGEKTSLAPKTRSDYGLVKGQPKPFIHGHNRRVRAHPSTLVAKPCGCGCGNFVKPDYVLGKVGNFLRGHYLRKAKI